MKTKDLRTCDLDAKWTPEWVLNGLDSTRTPAVLKGNVEVITAAAESRALPRLRSTAHRAFGSEFYFPRPLA